MNAAPRPLAGVSHYLTVGCAVGSALSPPCRAGERPYRVGPIAAALGGAGRAAADPTEAAWLNPAALVHVRNYHADFSAQQSSYESGDSYRDFGVMLSDGGPDRMASGAFSYVNRRTLRGGPGEIAGSQQDIQFSLASFVPFPRWNISVGATYRYLIHEQHGADISQSNVSLAALVPFGHRLGIGFVASDLVGAGDSVPPEARLIPTLSVGLNFAPITMFRLRVDWTRALEQDARGFGSGGASADADRSDVRAGIESWFREDFAFRLGGAWVETRDQMWVTTGIGFKGPRLSFGYAFERDMRSESASRHTFDLWMPL